ncbi:hypothetical protein B0H14DRAFT_2677519 [Mycena olivaceomarginata]|nr:hypothetical protein B0H14DRAFT_2677519 [Mycena olivaceomarginata]
MDTDLPARNDSDADSDSDSGLDSVLASDSDSEQDERSNPPITVQNFCIDTTKDLSTRVQAFPNISTKQREAWSTAVSQVTKSALPTFKIALLGKTGSGKSTLINCLLEQPTSVLPSSAARACTSAVTEIAFKDSDEIEGTVVFVSKDHWSEVLERLLDDIRSAEEDYHASPASKAQEKLLKIYPQFKGQDWRSPTILADLMNADPVQERLGTSFELPPSDPFSGDFRVKLEQFLSSSSNSNSGALWPLVQRVEIRGRFPVLSTGVILVDLPGSGDDDEFRNNSAAEYIKTADGVILVADVKRAQDDRDTLSYLRQHLNQFIVDGRLSGDEFMILAMTGNDVPFVASEIVLGETEKAQVDQIDKVMKGLVGEQEGLGKTKKVGKVTTDLSRPRKKRKLNDGVADQIRAKQREKALLLAVIRSANVRSSMQDFFHRIHSELAPGENGDPPQLPIFCVGSHDFRALMTGGLETPLVFSEEDETEIPDLQRHIHAAGLSRRLKWAADLLERADAFSESIHLYFSEGRHSGDLPAENKQKALDVIAALETRNRKEVDKLLDGIKTELSNIADNLSKTVAKAIDAAPEVIEKFSNGMRWNTYRACMKRDGWYISRRDAHDLNLELTRDIFPDIQVGWNKAVNTRIPSTIRGTIETVKRSTLEAIENVVEALSGPGALSEETTAAACRSLAIEPTFRNLSSRCQRYMSTAQKDGTRSFDTIVREQMSPQYRLAAQESGAGSLARMKNGNLEFMKHNALKVFNPINICITGRLDKAVTHIEDDMHNELRDLTASLRLCLIEEIKLPKDHKELKERILRLVTSNRPRFASKKTDIEKQQLSLNT